MIKFKGFLNKSKNKSKFSDSTINAARKKKLLIIFGGVTILGALMLNTREKPKEVKAVVKDDTPSQFSKIQQQKENASAAQSLYPTANNDNNQQLWLNNGQKQINALSNNYNSVSTQVSNLQTDNADLKTKVESLNILLDAMVKQQQALKPQNQNASGPISVRGNGVGDYRKPRTIQVIDMNDDDGGDASAPVGNVKQDAPQQSQATKDSEKKKLGLYIPSGSFTQGNLISAIDANTGGNASGDPTPMTIRLTNLAQLPNFARANIKNCFVTASGFGDLSTERVKARLGNLSCVKNDGSTIDIPVKGFIAGEDGKAGIKGKVVVHEGSVLAKATLAGFLAGIGNTLATASTTQMVSPVGTTTTINPSQAAGNAAGQGAGNAFNTLSTYYVNMLNQITPTIMISSGRNVTVNFTEGVQLDSRLDNTDFSNSNNVLPLNNY
jgi:hypothetical protein